MYARDVDFVGGFLGSIPPLLVPEITGSRSASIATRQVDTGTATSNGHRQGPSGSNSMGVIQNIDIHD